MTNKMKKGTALVAVLAALVLFPLAYNQAADAYGKTSVATPDTFFRNGDLTAPQGDKPFGGQVVGSYYVRVNGHDVRITATLNDSPSQGKVLEGWLVDLDTGYKLSIGQLNNNEKLFFTQTIVNPAVYDVLVITEEPMGDTDPNPTKPVGGSHL